jgi:hypothetical protein
MKVKNRPIYTLNCEGRLPKQKTVIVFGLGRGGTSAVAGVLRELGVVLPNAHPLKHEWSPVCCGNGEVDLVSTLSNLHRLDNMHDVWGWKSPKDVFVLNQIESYIRNPVIVVVFRNLLESCLSGANTTNFTGKYVPKNTPRFRRGLQGSSCTVLIRLPPYLMKP